MQPTATDGSATSSSVLISRSFCGAGVSPAGLHNDCGAGVSPAGLRNDCGAGVSPADVHPAAPHFDYGSLAPDVRVLVGAQTAAIRGLIGDTLAGKIEIGRRLVAIRQAVGRFDFRPLVFDAFRWTKTTTSNYMSVARVFGKLKPRRLARFDWSALVVLACGTVPRSARAEALARARAGETIDKPSAEEIVARRRGLPEPDPHAERVVDRLYQALRQFDEHNLRLTAAQRRRVSQRLAASALRLDHPSEETAAANRLLNKGTVRRSRTRQSSGSGVPFQRVSIPEQIDTAQTDCPLFQQAEPTRDEPNVLPEERSSVLLARNSYEHGTICDSVCS